MGAPGPGEAKITVIGDKPKYALSAQTRATNDARPTARTMSVASSAGRAGAGVRLHKLTFPVVCMTGLPPRFAAFSRVTLVQQDWEHGCTRLRQQNRF